MALTMRRGIYIIRPVQGCDESSSGLYHRRKETLLRGLRIHQGRKEKRLDERAQGLLLVKSYVKSESQMIRDQRSQGKLKEPLARQHRMLVSLQLKNDMDRKGTGSGQNPKIRRCGGF